MGFLDVEHIRGERRSIRGFKRLRDRRILQGNGYLDSAEEQRKGTLRKQKMIIALIISFILNAVLLGLLGLLRSHYKTLAEYARKADRERIAQAIELGELKEEKEYISFITGAKPLGGKEADVLNDAFRKHVKREATLPNRL